MFRLKVILVLNVLRLLMPWIWFEVPVEYNEHPLVHHLHAYLGDQNTLECTDLLKGTQNAGPDGVL